MAARRGISDEDGDAIVDIDGSALKTLREKKRWTCGRLAQLSGVGARTIRRFESGERDRAKVYTTRYLAKALGVLFDASRSRRDRDSSRKWKRRRAGRDRRGEPSR